MPRLTRTGWCTVLLPTIGPIMSGARANVPSFDDVEKMLQLFGIVSALILSVVTDAASYDYEFPGDKTMQGRAYTAFGLCIVSLVHVLVTYVYLVATVDQESKIEGEQMRQWWRFGKLNLFLQVFFIVYTLVEFITYVNITHLDGYNDAEDRDWQRDRLLALYGVDNNMGLFKLIYIEYALIFVLFGMHIAALPVMIYNDKKRTEVEETSK